MYGFRKSMSPVSRNPRWPVSASTSVSCNVSSAFWTCSVCSTSRVERTSSTVAITSATAATPAIAMQVAKSSVSASGKRMGRAWDAIIAGRDRRRAACRRGRVRRLGGSSLAGAEELLHHERDATERGVRMIEELLAPRCKLVAERIQVHARCLDRREQFVLLLADVMLNLLAEHLHRGVEPIVVDIHVVELLDQVLDAFVLHFRFIDQRIGVQGFPAQGIEDGFLQSRMQQELGADLARNALLDAAVAPFPERLEALHQRSDTTMIIAQQVESVHTAGLRSHEQSPMVERALLRKAYASALWSGWQRALERSGETR